MLVRALATTLVVMVLAGVYGYATSLQKRRDMSDLGKIGCDAAISFGIVFAGVAVYDIAQVGIHWMGLYGNVTTDRLFYGLGIAGALGVSAVGYRSGKKFRQLMQRNKLVAEIDRYRSNQLS